MKHFQESELTPMNPTLLRSLKYLHVTAGMVGVYTQTIYCLSRYVATVTHLPTDV